MRKFALKTARAVLCIAFGLVLFACPKPVSVDDYLNDPAVVVIIERGKGSVILTTDSEGKPGPGRITGLVAGKYYIIDECDSAVGGTTLVTDTKFVTASGGRTAIFTGIGRLNGTTIEGLTNDQIYRVKSAASLPDGSVTVTPAGGTSPAISGGAITLPASSASLDLSPFVASTYDIVRCPYPAGAALSVPTPPGSTITFEPGDAGTTNDYVFFDKNTEDFRVLRVTILSPTGTIEISLVPYVFSTPSDATITFSPANVSLTVALAGTSTINISVTNAATEFTAGFGWYKENGTPIVTGAAITKSDITGAGFSLTSPNTFELIFKGEKSGVPYSGTFTVEITP